MSEIGPSISPIRMIVHVQLTAQLIGCFISCSVQQWFCCASSWGCQIHCISERRFSGVSRRCCLRACIAAAFSNCRKALSHFKYWLDTQVHACMKPNDHSFLYLLQSLLGACLMILPLTVSYYLQAVCTVEQCVCSCRCLESVPFWCLEVLVVNSGDCKIHLMPV